MTLHFPDVELNCVKTGGRYIYIHMIEKKNKLYILVLFANHFISVTGRRTLKSKKKIISFWTLCTSRSRYAFETRRIDSVYGHI